jgi:hypothetical protein
MKTLWTWVLGFVLVGAWACSGRTVDSNVPNGSAQNGVSSHLASGGGDGGGNGGGGGSGETLGPLPDPCPDGQDMVCDQTACSCGVPPTDPSSCAAQVSCNSDSECGNGNCCHAGSCIAQTDPCACGDQPTTMSSSAGPGCDGIDDFVTMLEQQAQSYCLASGPFFGDSCGELGKCVGSAAIGQVVTKCIPPPTGSHIGGQIATVCFHCDEEDPPDAPPDNNQECDDLAVQIMNQKAQINTKGYEIQLMADGIAKYNAAIASTQAVIDGLVGAEDKLMQGTYGDNIFYKTAGESTKFVTDVYAGAKIVKTVQGVACLGKTAWCGTNLVGKVPQYSWKNVVVSKKAWGNVYEPAAQAGIAKIAGGAACPPTPPDNSWVNWWPGGSSALWAIGSGALEPLGICSSTTSMIAEIGEKRSSAQNLKQELITRRNALTAQRDQALQDLGVLKAKLTALQKEYDAKCTCAPPGEGGGGSGGR